jgi:hypothetical protein
MRPAIALLAVAMALAGCAHAPAPPPAPTLPVVEGWVLDEALRPVAGATTTLAGYPTTQRTDETGHYRLEVPSGTDATVTVEAPGFTAKSAFVGAGFGARATLNFTLARLPEAKPYTLLQDHRGQLACAVSAVVGQDDPGKPHQHKGARCAEVVPSEVDDGNRWLYEVPAGTTGVVLEVYWTPNSDLSQALVLRADIADTGETIGFAEGTSPIHVQLSQLRVEQMHGQGHPGLNLTILPGAGTGSHEHGAVGIFVEQPFRMFATAFFNQAVDPTYSVGNTG